MNTRTWSAKSVMRETRSLFRAFRQTRPFWGGLWTMIAGLWIVRIMNFPFALALNGGWEYSAGYVIGGALVLFGLAAWIAPYYRGLVGIATFVVAIVAFPAANLGGFLVGSLLGIFGSSLILSWGEKAPRKPRDRRRRRPDARADANREVAP